MLTILIRLSWSCIQTNIATYAVELPLNIRQCVRKEGIFYSWVLSNIDGIENFEVGAKYESENGEVSESNLFVPITTRFCVLTDLLPYIAYSTFLTIHYISGKAIKISTGKWRTWPSGS